MNDISVMGHLVAGFPNREGFEAACSAMGNNGIDILEIQIPFSDPTADGPLNTAACEQALAKGFKVSDIFDYIAFAQKTGFKEIHIMTYANIAYRMGIKKMVDVMDDAGVTGLIIPDLPLEDEEGFYEYAKTREIDAVPVGVVNMLPCRIDLLRKLNPQRCYVSMRQGVTGQATTISRENLQFLDSLPVPKLYCGFGIRSAEHIAALMGHAHAAVVGSYFTEIITRAAKLGKGRTSVILEEVTAGVKHLLG